MTTSKVPLNKVKLVSPFSALLLIARLFLSLGWARLFCKLLIYAVSTCPAALWSFVFRPRKVHKDVIISTFIKSGTNLAMQVLVEIAWKGRAPADGHIHDLVPWPDFLDQGITVSMAAAPSAPETDFRIIKTHANNLPYRTDTLYVVLFRDPKEIVVSAYYFLFGVLGVKTLISLDQWMDICLDSFLYLWARNVAHHWPWRKRSNVFLRTFSQMVANHKQSTRDLTDFMQVDLTEQEMQQVLDKSSFDYMKQNQDRFAPPISPLSKIEEYPDMIRRGKVGRSDELLSAQHQQAIDDYCRKTLLQLGSDFPYDENFCCCSPIGDTSNEKEAHGKRHLHNASDKKNTTVSSSSSLLFLLVSIFCFSRLPGADANTAAGLETLIGIQGRDFVLLGADTAVGPSILWTATRVDKIAPVGHGMAVAAAGDAADADRLVGLLQAQAKLMEYEQGLGRDVTYVRVGQEPQFPQDNDFSSVALTVSQMAQLARTQIAQQLRSRDPYRICLLVAGMQPHEGVAAAENAAWTQHLQAQVQQGRASMQPAFGGEDTFNTIESQKNNVSGKTTSLQQQQSPSSSLRPCLFWLDEYGTILDVPYGAHGIGSVFMNAILDEGYHGNLTRQQARTLMLKCFAQLRQRYAIQAPQPPCIKCIDQDGVHLLE